MKAKLPSNTTVLVTGGRGYIGRHVVSRLIRGGAEVISLDLPTKSSPCELPGAIEVGIDLKDRARVSELFAERQRSRPIQAVVHLASLIEVGESLREPIRYYDENLSQAGSLLNAMHAHRVRKLAFASSAAVYGSPGDVTLHEGLSPAAINPYGVTKVVIEQMLTDLTNRGALDAISLRLFNVAGLGPESEGLHTVPVGLGLIIPLLRKVALEKRSITEAEYARVGVLSRGFLTPDGTALRDYVQVSDVAEAFAAALQALFESKTRGAFNIASGRSVSIVDVIRETEKITGHSFDIQWREAPAGFPSILRAATGKAREELGFSAEHLSLESLIRPVFSRIALGAKV